MHNQTMTEWLAGVTPDTPGTGIFLLPVLELPVPETPPGVSPFVRRHLVRGVTYPWTVNVGRYVSAFKWVPESIASYDSLLKSNCTGVFCVDSCLDPGCVCDQNTSLCVSRT